MTWLDFGKTILNQHFEESIAYLMWRTQLWARKFIRIDHWRSKNRFGWNPKMWNLSYCRFFRRPKLPKAKNRKFMLGKSRRTKVEWWESGAGVDRCPVNSNRMLLICGRNIQRRSRINWWNWRSRNSFGYNSSDRKNYNSRYWSAIVRKSNLTALFIKFYSDYVWKFA